MCTHDVYRIQIFYIVLILSAIFVISGSLIISQYLQSKSKAESKWEVLLGVGKENTHPK